MEVAKILEGACNYKELVEYELDVMKDIVKNLENEIKKLL